MEATTIATKWVIDPMHSEVQFKVKHLVISTVTGFFKSLKVMEPKMKILTALKFHLHLILTV